LVHIPDPLPTANVPWIRRSPKDPLSYLISAPPSKRPVRIGAMGSSSTAGRGRRLPIFRSVPRDVPCEPRDQKRFPNLRSNVLIRGRKRGGYRRKVPRFEYRYFRLRGPSRVIWQGPNQAGVPRSYYEPDKYAAAAADRPLSGPAAPSRLDVAVDPQYFPRCSLSTGLNFPRPGVADIGESETAGVTFSIAGL